MPRHCWGVIESMLARHWEGLVNTIKLKRESRGQKRVSKAARQPAVPPCPARFGLDVETRLRLESGKNAKFQILSSVVDVE